MTNFIQFSNNVMAVIEINLNCVREVAKGPRCDQVNKQLELAGCFTLCNNTQKNYRPIVSCLVNYSTSQRVKRQPQQTCDLFLSNH